MLLQKNRGSADSLSMDATLLNSLTESSDQELVDSYTTHVPVDLGAEMTARQVSRASEAAHALELRGYTEQAGIWRHEDLPALQATA